MANVLQLISGLIGKQDINWGDSSTTFSRETHDGGSISINYVDAEAIPATGLGGYIGDHLHTQNTDSLTTSLTFGINGAGISLVFDSTGLSASRTFTFPDTGDQELVGGTDLAATSTGLGASLVGVEDTGDYYAGATAEAALQEAGWAIETLEDTTHNRGMANGLELSYGSTTTVWIDGGMWALTGTTNRHVYLGTQTPYTVSSLAASDISYIYIDDSAVTAADSNALVVGSFTDSTTAPTYSAAKAGWYSSTTPNDRCIGAVVANASSQIRQFGVYSSHCFMLYESAEAFAVAAAPISYTELNLSSWVPVFATMARVVVQCNTAGTTFAFHVSATGTTATVHTISTNYGEITVDVPLTSTQRSYWLAGASNSSSVRVVGFFTDRL